MDLALSVNEKAVSVGEESNVSIINSKFHDVGIGVVSKDGSRAVVSSTILILWENEYRSKISAKIIQTHIDWGVYQWLKKLKN